MRAATAWITAGLAAACVALPASGTARTWDDDSGDHMWTNDANWSGDSKPSAGEAALFDNAMTGPSMVNTDYTVKYLEYANTKDAADSLRIAPGATLLIDGAGGYVDVGCSKPDTHVTVTGGGALQIGNTTPVSLTVARATEGSPTTMASMVITEGLFKLGNVSSVTVGMQATTGYKPAIGLLDVSRATIVSGSDTNVLRACDVCLGGSQEGRGTLRLNPAVTNITIGTLTLGGRQPFASGFLDLGTNSQLRSLVITNDLLYKHGSFLCYDGAGHAMTGLPGNVAFRMGASTNQRAGTLGIADGGTNPGNADATVCRIGEGIGTFEAYLNSLLVASGSVNGHHRYGSLDLRNATLIALDVDGPIKIGGPSSHGTVCLPAGRVICANLQVNMGSAGLIAGDGMLSLSNTDFVVSGDVHVGDPYSATAGVITDQINGVSSGINMTGSLAVTNGGRMYLDFIGPPDAGSVYWGLRMVGNQKALLDALHAAGGLTWSLSGLSASQRARFGIHYDVGGNDTYVGLEPERGTLIEVR